MADNPFRISEQLAQQGYTRIPGSARRYVSPTGEEVSRRQAEQAVIRTSYPTISSREQYYTVIVPERVPPSVVYGQPQPEVPFEWMFIGSVHGDYSHRATLEVEDYRPYWERTFGYYSQDEYSESDFQNDVFVFYNIPWGTEEDDETTLNAVNWARDHFGWIFDWETHEFDYGDD